MKNYISSQDLESFMIYQNDQETQLGLTGSKGLNKSEYSDSYYQVTASVNEPTFLAHLNPIRPIVPITDSTT